MKPSKHSKDEKRRVFLIQGKGASPGFARGKAIIVGRGPETESQKSGRIGASENIVVVMETPRVDLVMEWIEAASGFIFETGGRLCHAALVCLEIGKPCIVGATGLIERLSNDSVLEIDAFTGRVTEFREKNYRER